MSVRSRVFLIIRIGPQYQNVCICAFFCSSRIVERINAHKNFIHRALTQLRLQRLRTDSSSLYAINKRNKNRLFHIKLGFNFLHALYLILFSIQKECSETPYEHVRLRVKYMLFFFRLNQTCIFSTHFNKNSQHRISRNAMQRELSFPMRTRQTEGQTDVKKLMVAFHTLANSSKVVLK